MQGLRSAYSMINEISSLIIYSRVALSNGHCDFRMETERSVPMELDGGQRRKEVRYDTVKATLATTGKYVR